MPCGQPHPRYPYPTTEEADALLGRREGGEELRQRQLKQLQEQLPRLDAMIQRATTLKDLHRFQGWKKQLIRTLKKEGVKVPKATTKTKCEHKRWLLTGNMQTCKKCGFKKPQPGRKTFEVTAEHRQAVIEYIKSQPEGKRGPWSEFAKAVGVSGSNLGVVVRAMLQDGTISEPAGKGSMVYTVVPNNKKAREAAVKLYEEQRQEGDSPKGRAPVSLEEKRRAKARKARSKAA